LIATVTDNGSNFVKAFQKFGIHLDDSLFHEGQLMFHLNLKWIFTKFVYDFKFPLEILCKVIKTRKQIV